MISKVSQERPPADLNTIFIHGYGGQPEYWDCLRDVLPEELRGTAVTLPGHGQRNQDRAPFTIERAATEIAKSLPPEGGCLIGHSMGTRIAMSAAALAPDAVRGLVLVDGSCVPTDPAKAGEAVRHVLVTRGMRAFAEETVRDELTHRLTETQRENMFASVCRVPEQALIDFMSDMANWDNTEFQRYLAVINRPVLVLQSTRFPIENAPRREEIFTDPSSQWFNTWAETSKAQMELIKSAGHYPMMDQTGAVAEQVLRFTRSL